MGMRRSNIHGCLKRETALEEVAEYEAQLR
jgi:hypothetical protein